MSARMAARRWRLAVRLAAGALVWSAGLVLTGLLVPVYGSSTTSNANGVTLTRSTLAQENGVRAIVLIAVPLLISVLVLWAIRARRAGARWGAPVAWAGVGVVAIETVLGILTIGIFILPVVIMLAAAVRLAPGPMPDAGAAGDMSAAPAAGA